ncbi:Hypothetical protein PHPALM_3906 [Phytophthora palmivora]|uniref:Uncharacterized protein n=1 Tax=Phytophthora palmivora TaxID=4796 RepID=A0A2P4YL76_9STRA|nr:Hypothetical protein PHPALM_3906 [Phytophthora palmivora]
MAIYTQMQRQMLPFGTSIYGEKWRIVLCNHVRDRTWLSLDNIRYNKSGNEIVLERFEKTSKQNSDDYHGNFNSELFEEWFEELCITLDTNYGPCVIHMDGAGYHKRITNEMPTSKSLRRWLENYFSKIANTIATKNHHILHYTSPYHLTLQPIELIWGLIKNSIASDSPKSGADAVEKVLAGLAEVKSAEWLARFRHVQKIEDEYLVLQQELES